MILWDSPPLRKVFVVAEHVTSEKDYTREVLSLYLNFKDAVREGDGDRVIQIWKPMFNTKNMPMEALTLLSVL